MSKVMFSLPDQLIYRMKAVIPAGERSQILAQLLEQAIVVRETQLFEAALSLEANQGLKNEMAQWDKTFGGDGLDEL